MQSNAIKWSEALLPPVGRQACGLRRPAPGEPADAASAESAVALGIAGSTVEARAQIATAMGRTLAERVYVAPRVVGALPALQPERLDAALYLVRPLGSGAYGSVCAAGVRRPSAPAVAAATTAEPTSSPSSTRSSRSSSTATVQKQEAISAARLPLAVKVTPGGDAPAVAVREALLTGMLSALVRTRACPNLPCIYGTAVAYPDRDSAMLGRLGVAAPGSVSMFQEMADCDLGAWMDSGAQRSEAEWMSVVFQVCAGLAWAARVYDIVNNDLYARNILLSRILAPATPPSFVSAEIAESVQGRPCARTDLACPVDPVFRYALQSRVHGWRRFAVRTHCWLARATDFALATSDRLRALGVDIASHDDLAALYGATPPGTAGPAPTRATPASLASLVDAGATARHVIFHPYLNAYARDMAVLLATVAQETSAPLSVRRWALYGLHALYAEIVARETPRPTSALFASAVRAARRRGGQTQSSTPQMNQALNRAFRQPDDLIDFMTGVLFDDALLRQSGLPEGLFADGPAAAAAAGDQFFALPLLDTPPPIEPAVAGASLAQPVQALARVLEVPL